MLGDLNIAEPKALIGFAVRVLSNRPFAKNCRQDSSAVIPDREGRDRHDRPSSGNAPELASILAKLMNLPAPNPEAPLKA